MKPLFKVWPDVLKRLRSAGRILLLSDYDGTLTPIAKTPAEAVLAEEMRQLLQSLNDKNKFMLGVISGRKLDEIQRIIGIPDIYYAGNHGLEMQGPKLHYFNPQATKSRAYLSAILQGLEEKLAHIAGIIAEDKGLSLSLHYRLVPEDRIKEVKRIFDQVCESYVIRNRVRITKGKKVLEVRPPVDWNKGRAVLALKDCFKAEDELITIYMGDDHTDEDAFSVLKNKADISVLVGGPDQASRAEYFLEDVEAVKKFFKRLLELQWAN